MRTEKFEAFALVELFGHNRLSGKVTEQTIGGASFIRVDVPETNSQPAFSRLLNPSAIYAINPITEETMIEMARNLDKAPLASWDVRETVRKAKAALEAPSQPERELEFEEEEDDLPY